MHRAEVTVIFCLFLGACASPLPRALEYTRDEVINKSTLPKGAPSSITLEQSKHLLSGWRKIYNDAQAGRHDLELGFGESTFYGSILAVIGIATHYDRVRNVGAGIAGMSTLTEGHYKLAIQRAAFQKAESRIACLEKTTLQITPRYVQAFAVPANLRDTLTDLPGMLVSHTEAVHAELRNALQAIVLTAPSRQEIEDAFARLKEDKAQVPKSVSVDTNEKNNHLMAFGETVNQKQQEEEKLAFISALTTVKSEMTVCTKTGS